MSTVTELAAAIAKLLEQVDADLGSRDVQIAALAAKLAECEAREPPPPPPPPPDPQPTATVKTLAELTAAWNAAKGGETIVIANGNYAKFTAPVKAFSQNVTLKAATKHGAVFAGCHFGGSSGFTVDGLKFTAQMRGDGAKSFTFRNCATTGGAYFIRTDDYVVEGCDIAGGGIAFVNNHVTNFVHRNNYIHHGGSDLYRITGTTFNGLVENNTFFDVAPVTGDHPDGIQMLAVNNITPRDIIIRGNFLFDDPATTGGGGTNYGMQGIFLDDAGPEGYQNITIEQNLLLNGHPNGIFISNGKKGCIIRNNSMRSWKHDGGGGQIRLVLDCSGTEVYGNVASAINLVSPVGTPPKLTSNLQHGNNDDNLFQPWEPTWRGLLPKAGSPIDFGSPYGAQVRLKELMAG